MSLFNKLDQVIKDFHKQKNLNDANFVSIFRTHLTATIEGSRIQIKETHKNNLIKGINILVDVLERMHWESIMDILKASNLIQIMDDDLRRLLEGYASNTEEFDISDKLFYTLVNIHFERLPLMYNKDILTNYDRFIKMLNVIEDNISTLERLILNHQDYFIRALKDYPHLWDPSKMNFICTINDEKIFDIILDNIPYYEDIYLYANRRSNIPRLAGFVNKISNCHRLILDISLLIIPNNNNHKYLGVLSNSRYDEMKLKLHYSLDDLKDHQKQCLMLIVINNFDMIKQAKNYMLQHKHAGEHKHVREHAEILWKFNFKRMFTYRSNMDIISITEVSSYS